MDPIIMPEIGDRSVLRATQMSRFQTTRGQAVRAALHSEFLSSPDVFLLRMGEFANAQGGRPRGPSAELAGPIDPRRAYDVEPTPRLTEEEWRAGPFFREDLEYPEDGYTAAAARLIAERRDRRQSRDAVLAHAPDDLVTRGLVFAAGIAAGIVGGPISIGVSFVPIVGQMRFARLTSRFGKTGGRLVKGTIEDFTHNLALEPIVYAGARQEQIDHTMADSLMNIAFGTVFGAGLRVGTGAVGYAVGRFRQPTRQTAFTKAVGDVVEGRPVDVSMIARNDPLFVGSSLSTRSVTDIVGDAAARLRKVPPDARRAAAIDQAAPQQTLVASQKGGGARAFESQRMVGRVAIDQAAPQQTLVASQKGGGVRVFESQRLAERVARHRKRRFGDDLEVMRIGEDEFVLTRTTPVEFLRGTDGTVAQFPTERAARRAIGQLRDSEGLDVVPVGPAGPERRFALVRNAKARDLRDIRARPETVNLAAAEPVARAFDEAGAPVVAVRSQPAASAAQPAPARVEVLDATGEPRRVSGFRVSLKSAADPDDAAADAVTRKIDEAVDELDPAAVALLDVEVDALRAAGRVTAEDEAEIAEAIAAVAKLEDAEKVYVTAARCLTRIA